MIDLTLRDKYIVYVYNSKKHGMAVKIVDDSESEPRRLVGEEADTFLKAFKKVLVSDVDAKIKSALISYGVSPKFIGFETATQAIKILYLHGYPFSWDGSKPPSLRSIYQTLAAEEGLSSPRTIERRLRNLIEAAFVLDWESPPSVGTFIYHILDVLERGK